MTIAIDKRTGAVIGQTTAITRPSIPAMLNLPDRPHVTILCRDGIYLTVPLSAVRLEEVR